MKSIMFLQAEYLKSSSTLVQDRSKDLLNAMWKHRRQGVPRVHRTFLSGANRLVEPIIVL